MKAKASILLLTLILLSMRTLNQPALAQSESKAEARERYNRGKELVKEERYDQAVIEFERAYKLSKAYKILYNLGTAYMVLGNSIKAVEAFRLYLKKGGGQIPSQRRLQVEADIANQLERIAHLDIKVNIRGSQISVDGEVIGKSPLDKSISVTTGEHFITATHDGYQTEEKKVVAAGKDKMTLYFHLTELSSATTTMAVANGQLAVSCAVPDVQVSISGRVWGQTPIDAPLLVPVGRREVTFERKDYTTISRDVTISDGAMSTVKCDMRPRPDLRHTQTSIIELNISESGATPLVDGSPYSDDDDNRLPAGRHRIEVGRSGFSNWTKMVDLQPGETLEIDVDLMPEEDYRSEYESRAYAMRTMAYMFGIAGIATGAISLGLYIKNDRDFDEIQKERDRLDIEASGLLTPDSQTDLEKRYEKNSKKQHDILVVDAVVLGLAIGGSALFVSGLILFLVGDDPGKYEDMVATVDRNGARVGWRSTW